MAEKLSLRTDANGNIYVYVEDTVGASLAFGADSSNGVVALNTSSLPNVQPAESTANMTIDPGANGDILFRPHGTGDTYFDTGDVNVSAGNVIIPTSNSGLSQGAIYQNANRLLHTFGTNSIYCGIDAGNGTLDDATCINNAAFGNLSMQSITTGAQNNSAFGHASLFILESGQFNTAIAANALDDLTTGNNNTALGFGAGTNISTGSDNILIGEGAGQFLDPSGSSNIHIGNDGTGTDDNTIRIGTQGAGAGQQDRSFMAGIYGVTPAAGAQQLMIIDMNGQMGTTTGGSFGINTIHTESGDAVPAAGAVTITGGNNIGTSGAGSTVTVTVDNIVGQTNGGASIVPFVATATGNISETPGGAATMNSGTQSLSISSDASATTVNVATGAAVKTLTLGSTNSTSASTLQSGSGALNVTSTNGSLTINSGTGALSVSSDASATTVNLATGGAAKTVTLGSTNTTSALTLNSGSGGIKAVGVASVSVSNKNYVTIDTSTGALGSESVPTPTAMVLLQTATASTSANLVLSTGISSTYVAYFVSCNNLVYDSGANPTLRVEYSNDGGSSWIATNYNAAYLSNTWNSATIANTNSSTICPLAASASGAGNQISGYLWFQGLAGSGKTFHEGRFFAQNVHYQPYGWNSANNTINALRFSYSAGNITSGTISLYGLTH